VVLIISALLIISWSHELDIMSSEFVVVAYKRQDQLSVRRVPMSWSGAKSEDIVNAGGAPSYGATHWSMTGPSYCGL
jgi:hypothetical protein